MKDPILARLSASAKLIYVLLLVIVCFFILSLIGILLAIPLFHVNLFTDLSVYTDFQNPGSVPVLKYLQIIQSISLFILPALFAGFFFGGNTGNYLGMNKLATGRIFLATILIIFVSLPIINWATSLNEMIKLPDFLKGIEDWMKETEEKAAGLTEAFLNVNSPGGLLVNLLMIAVIPAIGEELFFRGLLQRLFAEWFRNVHLAIFLIAFLFAAIHLQFYGFLPRMILGVLFGYLFYWTGSIWVPVFAHFLNNASAVIISFLANRGTLSTGYEDFGATNDLFLVAGSILFTGGLLYIVYRSTLPHTHVSSDDISDPPSPSVEEGE
jgi:membrane protease YdiL (CAAX protease family)